jgi:hypothetical protein
MPSPTILLLIATAVFLIALGVWDCRRTFRRIDADHRRRVEPIDFAGEIHAYRVARDAEEAKGLFR